MTRKLQADQVEQFSCPGVFVEMLRDVAGATRDETSGTFVDIDANFSKTFIAPVSGWYVVTLLAEMQAITSWCEARFRLVFDAAEYVPSVDHASWAVSSGVLSSVNYGTCQDKVYLSAGSHTVKVQWRRSGGAGTIRIDSGPLTVLGQLISGSGAGGMIVTTKTDTRVDKSIIGTISPVAYTEVTELGSTFSSFANEQVTINLIASATVDNGSKELGAWAFVYVDDVLVSYVRGQVMRHTAAYQALNLSHSFTTAPLTAGSHTVKFKFARYTAADQDIFYLYGGVSQVIQYRGGLNQPDTKLPRLTWVSANTVSVAAAPGEPSTVRLTLQDGKQRWFTGTLTCLGSTPWPSGADLGLDTGAEAASTHYYAYAVPKSGNDDQLSVRLSANAPSVGPSGYTVWRYLGSIRNNASSDIIKRFYRDDVCDCAVLEEPYDSTVLSGYYAGGTNLSFADIVPATACAVSVLLHLQRGNYSGYTMVQSLRIDGESAAALFQQNSGNAEYLSAHVAGIVALPTSNKRAQYYLTNDGGPPTILSQHVYVTGYTDGYLS